MKFDFVNLPPIAFGRGQIGRIGELSASLGKRALLIYNGSENLAARVGEAASLDLIHFRQRGEPSVADVDRALSSAREAGCDCVIAAGGGSSIDAGKAVAGLLANGGGVTDYMEVVGRGQKLAKPSAPWIAIPTTAGTGAEVTRNAVIGWPEKKFKASIRSELLLPRHVLIDPELGVDVPPHVTAASGMDALCQCVEAYVSTGANPMTDALALNGVELAASCLKRAYEDGRDIEAREGMALAALCSGIALTNAGLGAVHGFAAPLGANFPVPHGVICGVLLPRVVAANIEALRAEAEGARVLRKYADLGRALTGRGTLDERDALSACSLVTTALARILDLPPLSTFGMTEGDVLPMVQLAKRASSMRYNPVELSDDALAHVLHQGLKGPHVQ